MKKILFTVLAAGMMLTSCNMDLDQPGTTLASESVQSVQDVEQFRNNLYNQLRAITSGSYVVGTDLQSDQFVGLRGNGGRGSRYTQSVLDPSSGEITGPYAGCYGAIGTCNFILQKADELVKAGGVPEDQMLTLDRYLGETYFMRAYFYYYLFDHYCQPYTEDKANKPALGLQLVDFYDPTIPNSEYPGRSTMAATVKLINDDLNTAYGLLSKFEETDMQYLAPNTPYLNSLVVKALQARMALLTRDWGTAITKANEVIDAGVYALTPYAQYAALWTSDQGTELMFVPFGDPNEAGSIGSFFDPFNYVQTFPSRVDNLPTANVINLYDDTDIRFNSFFYGLEMTIEAMKTAGFIFFKYPGNPAVETNNYPYINKPKPFRLTEMYLIVAEASYEKNLITDANDALKAVRKVRINRYNHTDLAGTALRDAIREERAKEFVGEGFRFSDLRRWNLGFQRDAFYGQLVPGTIDIATLFNNADLQTIYKPDDYRYTWPIPRNEIEVCPAMAGQQNPGY